MQNTTSKLYRSMKSKHCITKTYKNSKDRFKKTVMNISENFQLDDRIQCFAKNPAFIILEEH